MCGIFGLVNSSAGLREKHLIDISRRMLLLAESRGKDAAGIGVFSGDLIRIMKYPGRASVFVRSAAFRKFIREAVGEAYRRGGLVILTHARLATNGVRYEQSNNSPVEEGDVIGVHNGIIVNSDALLSEHFSSRPPGEVDSRVLFMLLDKRIGEGFTAPEAAAWALRKTEGSVSFAAFSAKYNSAVLGTNTGSLYSGTPAGGEYRFFASESLMLRSLLRLRYIQKGFRIAKLPSGAVCEMKYGSLPGMLKAVGGPPELSGKISDCDVKS